MSCSDGREHPHATPHWKAQKPDSTTVSPQDVFNATVKMSTTKEKKNTQYYGRRTIEILGLKTERTLNSADQLDDDQVVAKHGSKRRAIASSVTGVAINSLLSLACPVFWIPACINFWQLVVALEDRDRTKEELRARMSKDPKFKHQCEEPKVQRRIRDIAIGCSIKTGLTAISAGIVGIDNITESFEKVFGHGVSTTAGAVTTEAVHTGATHAQQIVNATNVTAVTPDPGDDPHGLKSEYPRLMSVDETVHHVFELPEKVAEHVSQTPDGEIKLENTAVELKAIADAATNKEEIFAKAAVIGASAELLQPVAKLAEYRVDRFVESRDMEDWLRDKGHKLEARSRRLLAKF
ncbi:hypothetical protein CBER1_08189 [Cercospora berteroae]|uniref:Uncharacterized protein n=1 Tax=Cercospora berteroae TaxID=357750 RepID=A0A2S6BWC3_9PEZI|nr:hypothetical protein CBER1_08189 [Cercospora berteroae]